MERAYPEHNESLWSLARAPLIWVIHFMLCYLTPAIYCAKIAGVGGPLGPARLVIALLTLIAASALAWTAYRACRRMGAAPAPHGQDAAKSRTAFMGYVDLLLSLLSLAAVLMSALPSLFIQTCE